MNVNRTMMRVTCVSARSSMQTFNVSLHCGHTIRAMHTQHKRSAVCVGSDSCLRPIFIEAERREGSEAAASFRLPRLVQGPQVSTPALVSAVKMSVKEGHRLHSCAPEEERDLHSVSVFVDF